MIIKLPYDLAINSTVKKIREAARSQYRDEEPSEYSKVHVYYHKMGKKGRAVLMDYVEDDVRSKRVFEAIERAEAGDFDKTIPSFFAFMPSLVACLKHHYINGWIFKKAHDGKMYPYALTSVSLTVPADDWRRNKDEKPHVKLTYAHISPKTQSNYGRGDDNVDYSTIAFEPGDVTRKTIKAILENENMFIETQEMIDDHELDAMYYEETVRDGFGDQFRYHGGKKAIHNLKAKPKHVPSHTDSDIYDKIVTIPYHPMINIFDLGRHEFKYVNAAFMTPYKYDHSLRDKLVLPDSHRDLLDVLTSNLDDFLGDIIEGKAAGNIVVSKGIPGIGKTLTAEVYAELINKPLYSVHSGELGTSAGRISENLEKIFKRQKEWGCVLLLDEADVFVKERGDNIEQNAIVAEFLRVLEYYDGLLFMTTNRPNDIDEAIISRSAAVIHYEVPNEKNRAAIWKVMFENYKQIPDPIMIADLVHVFPTIAPRDIKMLLRLALRVASFEDKTLSIDILRRCAMFRNVEISDYVPPSKPKMPGL